VVRYWPAEATTAPLRSACLVHSADRIEEASWLSASTIQRSPFVEVISLTANASTHVPSVRAKTRNEIL